MAFSGDVVRRSKRVERNKTGRKRRPAPERGPIVLA
jgi:hypothetical protein